MSASSNLKDAVQALENTAVALNESAVAHVSSAANLVSDTEVQAAADKINGIVASLSSTLSQLQPK